MSDLKSTVRNEQIGAGNDVTDNSKNLIPDEDASGMEESIAQGNTTDESFNTNDDREVSPSVVGESDEIMSEMPEELTVPTEAPEKVSSAGNVDSVTDSKPDESSKTSEDAEASAFEKIPEEESEISTDQPQEEVIVKTENPVMNGTQPEPKSEIIEEEISINYAALSKEDLVKMLHDILEKQTVDAMSFEIENIKINYYKKHKAEIERKRKLFVEQGGLFEDFKVEDDPLELEIKELLKKYRDLKAEYNKVQEENKHKNLEDKYRIIEGIKELISKKESINRTFQEFRDFQKQWRTIGPVPQQNVKDLWETYHHHVEAFYDYIRINQELRDLDLKKNLEAKLLLCENAEELLLEPNVVEAFKSLQELHEQWREIGPVPVEMRVEIWNRFKEATSKINKKHQEFFVELKNEQKSNLDNKIALCEKVEEICSREIKNNKDWIKFSDEIMELQKVWKTIGFAPKKDNAKIYKRFRDACDGFFNRKREFFGVFKEEQNNNLQLKIDLCVQAEALKDSTEWKKTTEELIALQQRWKEIGPVPHKHSDKVWKRFRTACDAFFEQKSKHFAEVDNSFESNFQKKLELIKNVEDYQIGENAEEGLNKLKDFQRQWSEIGFVPLKEKDSIQEKYREAINKKFDELKIDDSHKNLLKFKSKLEGYLEKPNGMQRIKQEREKYVSRLKQLESDIVLWENNIGFFARSRNAENMIKDVENKIETTKKNIELLNYKINMIDDLDD